MQYCFGWKILPEKNNFKIFLRIDQKLDFCFVNLELTKFVWGGGPELRSWEMTLKKL